MASDVDQPPPARVGRAWLLSALHELAPLDGAPLLAAHAFLMAAATAAERYAAARLHEVQAAQLRDDARAAALADAYTVTGPIRIRPARGWCCWPSCWRCSRRRWPR